MHEGFALRKVCDGHKSQRGLCTRGGAFARGASRFAWAFASPFARGGWGGASTWAHPLCTRALGLCPLHEALHEGHHRLHEGQAAVCTRGAPTWASPLCTRGHKTHLHEGLHASRCCLHKGAPMWAFPLCTRGGGMTRLPCGPSPFTLGPSGFARGFARGGGAPPWSFSLCTRLCTRMGGGLQRVPSPFAQGFARGGVPMWSPPFTCGFARGGGGSHLASPPLHEALHEGGGLPHVPLPFAQGLGSHEVSPPPPFPPPPPLHFRGT